MGRRGRRPNLSNRGVNIKVTTMLADISIAPQTVSNLRFDITPSTVNGFSNWATLFRRYKVNRIRYTYRPQFNQSDPNISVGGAIYSSVDKWGAEPPISTLAEALNKSGVRRHIIYKPFTVYYRPVVAGCIFTTPASGAAINSVPRAAPYLDCNNGGGIVHYGHQVLFTNTAPGAGATVRWEVEQTVYLSFRERDGA